MTTFAEVCALLQGTDCVVEMNATKDGRTLIDICNYMHTPRDASGPLFTAWLEDPDAALEAVAEWLRNREAGDESA